MKAMISPDQWDGRLEKKLFNVNPVKRVMARNRRRSTMVFGDGGREQSSRTVHLHIKMKKKPKI
jgi:hypothetical protein